MVKVFKRTGRRKWYYKVRFASGEWSPPRTGFVDKRATEQKCALEQAAIDRGMVGLVDEFAETKATSFCELVDEFAKELELKGRSKRYVKDTKKRLELFCEAMQVGSLQDATIVCVEAFLGRLLRAEGLPPQRRVDGSGRPVARKPVSLRTRDAYVEAFWVFGAWLHKSERWSEHPFSKLERVARESDKRHPRRAFTAEQIEAVARAAEQRGVVEYTRTHPDAPMERLEEIGALGWARGVSYRLAGWAALRYGSEVGMLRWGDLVLDGDEPHVVIRAEHQKERRTDKIPLVGFVVEWLRELRHREARRSGSKVRNEDLVFSVGRNYLATLRKDVRFSGIGDADEQGRGTGSHSFRKGTCRMLALAGVPMAVTQKIVRHQDPKTTLNIYAEIEGLRDGLRELNKLGQGQMAPNVAPNPGPEVAASGRSGPLGELRTLGGEWAEEASCSEDLSPEAGCGRGGPELQELDELVGRTGLEPVTSTM